MADVVVVGAGPSGLAAAVALRRVGVRDVVVMEREREAGGIPRHSAHLGYGVRDLGRVMTGPSYAQAWVRRAVAAGVDLRTSTTVTDWSEDLQVTATSPTGRYSIDASAIVLATGCRERPRAARLVPGTRPAGVMTTGQLQQLVHLHHWSPGRRAVIVGAEHVSYSAALTLAEAGCAVVAMATSEPRHTSFGVFDGSARRRWRFPLHTRTTVSDIGGRERVEWVELTDSAGQARIVPCDTIVFTGDWIADHELARRHGVEIDRSSSGPVVDSSLRTTTPGVFAVGNLLHPAETADVCAIDGRHVAHSVLGTLHGVQWPGGGVPIEVDAPLTWVSPARITDASMPPRGRFVLRGSDFVRAPTLQVTQGEQVLWRGRRPWLVPTRPIYVPATWLDAVDPAGAQIRISVAPA